MSLLCLLYNYINVNKIFRHSCISIVLDYSRLLNPLVACIALEQGFKKLMTYTLSMLMNL